MNRAHHLPRLNRLVIAAGIWAAVASVAVAAPLASALQAECRQGQVFLTWREAAAPSGTTFNVYVANRPIADLSRSRRLAQQIERHSARDWWDDKASFTKGVASTPARGYRLQADGTRLDPTGGLFVHTVPRDHPAGARLYFAVTHTDSAGREDRTLHPGVNTLAAGVPATPGDTAPLWQAEGPPPAPGAGRGQALWLNLHGKSGVIADSEYLAFGDATLGWREGLPFRFSVRVQGGEVVIRPTDRTWINRPHDEAGDGGAPAIWSFWYGYNSRIPDRARMAQGTPTNYTERRLLWILAWVSRHYQTDPNRWYCSGNSMGGCGTLSFGLRHPELFAACHARVPIVSYTYLGAGSARRIEPSCWVGRIGPEVLTNEGVPLLDRLDSTKFVRSTDADLPFLFVLNGRRDDSIPWENNPPFYRALDAAAQGFAVYWDEGIHSTAAKDAPADVAGWTQRFRRFRLDQSYPAFSQTSTNRDPGNGAATDGDPIGWLNRGLDWKEIEDEADRYAITILADYPGIAYPVRTQITLRRVQRFRPPAGEALRVQVSGAGAPIPLTVSPDGRIRLPAIEIPDRAGTRLVIRRR